MNKLKYLFILSLPFVLFTSEAMARAGGGSGSGGGTSGGSSSAFAKALCTLIGALYLAWKNKQISDKGKIVEAALDKLAQRDPQWNRLKIENKAIQIFHECQEAWSDQDAEKLRELLHPSLFKKWDRELASMKLRREINQVTGISINETMIVDVRNFVEQEKDEFTIYFKVSCTDRTLQNGIVIKQDDSPFEEFWTLEWENGKWTLREVAQSNAWKKFTNRKIINESSKKLNKAA